jgi:hypothetical protein
MMAIMIRLPAIAALSLLGAAAGVHLGRSSIAEIDPIYFSSPASTRFFSDLSAQGYREDAPDANDPAAFWTAELDVVGPPACFGCDTRTYFERAPIYAEAGSETSFASDFNSAEAVAPAPPIDLDRYTSFPVTEEEASRPPGMAHRESYANSDVAIGGPDDFSESAEPLGM